MTTEPMTFWDNPLAYKITPKSGPMRPMETLLDANRALTSDLPPRSIKQGIWREVAKLLVRAAESGSREEIEAVSSELLKAVIQHGWMERPARVKTDRK
jgi:hypothetical protein